MGKLKRKQRKLVSEVNTGTSGKSSGSLLQLLIGIGLLGAGLFWIFQSVHVSSGFGSFYMLGSWAVPNGTIIIPLLAGILMLIIMERKIYGWIVAGLGIVIILLSICMSVRLRFDGGSLFNYIMMFGFSIVGSGLILKNLFKK